MATTEKLLPQNLDAEAAVIGSCLIDLSVVPSVAAIVKPEHFYREAHQEAWRDIVGLWGDGGDAPADLITLSDALDRRGKLEACGGISYISSLANQVPTSANAEYYAGIVARCYALRQLIRESGHMAALAYNQADPTVILRTMMDRLARLDVAGAGGAKVHDFGSVIDEMWDEVEAIGANEVPPGVYSGLEAVDKHTLGFRKKEMHIIAGRPGTFKSTVGAHFAASEALRQAGLRAAGKPYGSVLWFSFEMSRTQQARRLLASFAGINTRQIRGGFRLPDGEIHHKNKADFRATLEEYRPRLSGILKIVDAPQTLSELRAIVMREVVESNCVAIYLDQFDLLEPEEWTKERRQSELERLNDYSRGLKRLASTLEITVFVLVQLNRASVGETRPGLHNLAGTDRLGRDADGVFMTHYDKAEQDGDDTDELERRRTFLELNLMKLRDGEGGVTFPVRIEPKTSRMGTWPEYMPWPVDKTRYLAAPKSQDHHEPRDVEPAVESGPTYSQSIF